MEGVYYRGFHCITTETLHLFKIDKFSSPVDPPIIEREPFSSSLSVHSGETVILSIQVGGEQLSFQWFKDGVSLSEGSRISGTTTSTLTVSDIVSDDAGFYFLVVSNQGGNATSNGTEIIFGRYLHCFSLSVSLSNFVVDNSLTCTHTRTHTHTHTHMHACTQIYAHLQLSLALQSAYVELTKLSSTSNLFIISQIHTRAAVEPPPPTIRRDPNTPLSVTVFIDVTVILTTVATGEQLSFQWFKDGVNITDGPGLTIMSSDAQSSTLSILIRSTADGGEYGTIVSNPYGSATTNTTLVIVGEWIMVEISMEALLNFMGFTNTLECQ